MWWFTADEHYGHANIIEFCDRPFGDVDEMDEGIITRHNDVIKDGDTVVHVGDFSLVADAAAGRTRYVSKLIGHHIFVRGSHDQWLPRDHCMIWERTINGLMVVACHYAMRTWPRSLYGSVQLFGHSHGRLTDLGPRQMDVGVDTNNFYPYSLDEIIKKLGMNWGWKRRQDENQ